ncbi:MAG: Altronate dehydratase, partial [uncultured Acetobacteraceae bacterium]
GRELRRHPVRRGNRGGGGGAHLPAHAAGGERRTHQERRLRLRGGGVRALGARRDDV